MYSMQRVWFEMIGAVWAAKIDHVVQTWNDNYLSDCPPGVAHVSCSIHGTATVCNFSAIISSRFLRAFLPTARVSWLDPVQLIR